MNRFDSAWQINLNWSKLLFPSPLFCTCCWRNIFFVSRNFYNRLTLPLVVVPVYHSEMVFTHMSWKFLKLDNCHRCSEVTKNISVWSWICTRAHKLWFSFEVVYFTCGDQLKHWPFRAALSVSCFSNRKGTIGRKP